MLSAEECFLEANSLDNRNGEVWGFLTLINIELGRKNEAELCHREAVKVDALINDPCGLMTGWFSF